MTLSPADLAGDGLLDTLNPANAVKAVIETGLTKFFGLIVDGASYMLEQIFLWIDKVSVFGISTTTMTVDGKTVDSPIANLWPWMFWLGILMATGMVFWSITSSVIRRDGAALGSTVVGVVEFAIVTACFVAVVATLNEIAETMSQAILSCVSGCGGGADNQWSAMSLMDSSTVDTVESAGASVVMAVIALFSIFFGIILFLELAIRQAAILILVVTSPIAAAGLVSRSTRSWFGKTFTWSVGLIFAKPLIAMALVIAVEILKWSQGLAGMVGATAMLAMATLAPWGLVRMFSFAQGAVANNAMSRGASQHAVESGAKSLGSGARSAGHKAGVSAGSSPGQAEQQSATADRADSGGSGGKHGGGSAFGKAGSMAASGFHNGYSAISKLSGAATETMDSAGIGPHVAAGSPSPSARGTHSGGHSGSGGSAKAPSSHHGSPMAPSHGGSGAAPSKGLAEAQKVGTFAAENPEVFV